MFKIKVRAIDMIVILVTFLGLTLATATKASNDQQTYMGVQVGTLTIEDADLDYYQIKLGIELVQDLDLEFRTGHGFDDEELDGVDTELQTLTGLYLIRHLHVSEDISAFGMLGWAQGSIKASAYGRNVQVEENGPSYGIGLDIHGVTVEWTQYTVDSLDAVNALSVGYNYQF